MPAGPKDLTLGTSNVAVGSWKEPGATVYAVHPRNKLNDLTSGEWVKLTKSWLICDGRPADITDDIELHPASFPPDMLARFIRFFTKQGQTVFDPFVGCGSTLVAAYELGRKSVGIELSPSYYRNTVKRVSRLGPTFHHGPLPRVIQGDAREMEKFKIGPIDFSITSPPYWDMLKKSRGHADSVQKRRAKKGLHTDYGNDPHDLGTISDYESYLAELVQVFVGVRNLLRSDGYLVVVIQNVRTPSGEMYPLAWDFATKLKRHFLLQQEYVWCQNQKPLGCWGYPSVYVSNVHHHYCLVFKNSAAAIK